MSLPSHYLIPPTPTDHDAYLATLDRSLQAGTRLMLFKAKGLVGEEYRALARRVIELAHRFDCQVLLSGVPIEVIELGADGLHLDSKSLASCNERPLPTNYLLAVSGHSIEALQRGEALGANLGLLSPIKATSAHPDLEPLGWEGLHRAATALSIPLYALGGVSADDLAAAQQAGAQGIAGSRGYWPA